MDRRRSLELLYKQCRFELTEQQKKRDSLNAFFLTAVGLFAAFVLRDLDSTAAIPMTITLFALGLILAFAFLRYKILRDTFLVCCVVLQKLLFLPDNTKIDKDLINKLGSEASQSYLSNNLKTFKCIKSKLYSAETISYLIMVTINFINIVLLLISLEFYSREGNILIALGITFAIYLVYLSLMIVLFFTAIKRNSKSCISNRGRFAKIFLLDITDEGMYLTGENCKPLGIKD